MKKIRFLIELRKKDVLEFVEPSEDIMKSYLEKAKSNLESALILLNADKFSESLSLSYYSMYSFILALFFKCGIKCENHSACIIILKEIFEEEDLFKEISFAKKERIDKQYYYKFKLTREIAEEMIKKAEKFTKEMELIIKKFSNEEIRNIRKKLQEVTYETNNS